MKRRTKKFALVAVSLTALIAIVVGVALFSSSREISTWFTRGALERSGLEKKVYDHDRGHITYFEGGDGPPLVFVHGLSDQAGSWFRVAPTFSDDYTVVVVDLPRHGESPFRTDEKIITNEVFESLFYIFDQFADDTPITLVANSLGGWISMEYALMHPDRVERLLLANSAGLEHTIEPTLLMPSNREEARQTVETIFGDSAPYLPGFVLDQIVKRSGTAMVRDALEHADEAEYLDDRLPDLEAQTDLIWGTLDRVFPVDYAHRLHDRLPHSELHLIEGCGHSPQVGCPGEFIDLLQVLIDQP